MTFISRKSGRNQVSELKPELDEREELMKVSQILLTC